MFVLDDVTELMELMYELQALHRVAQVFEDSHIGIADGRHGYERQQVECRRSFPSSRVYEHDTRRLYADMT